MGGDITVESQLGKGSCFTIRLPAVAEAQDPDAGTARMRDDEDELVAIAQGEVDARRDGYAGVSEGAVAETEESKKRILIVDDDRSFLELAERLLLKEGFSAISTNLPRSVRQLARTVRPDAILLDILMPDFDGWAVLETLQRDPVTANIPVVILSIVDEKKRALEAGAAGVDGQAGRPGRAAESGERRVRSPPGKGEAQSHAVACAGPVRWLSDNRGKMACRSFWSSRTIPSTATCSAVGSSGAAIRCALPRTGPRASPRQRA